MNTPNPIRSPQECRSLIEDAGISIAEWARENRFSCGLVYQVLEGKRRCLRGQSHRIAVALGLKAGHLTDVQTLSQILAGLSRKEETM
ncbi:gp16 family phage-associated protein [Azonexus fungiphilus]|uniref:Gp16 family phage-associated protein n=1 Tax=Azonexus fungiphilus TaxID=146940 RepID=A0A495WC73_9RHOO|nr:DNA-binding protein [Azonexus fungiphilus]RKT58790.1 gp16 family phage-associated protein [Azonexus fungiphilus]